MHVSEATGVDTRNTFPTGVTDEGWAFVAP